MYIIHNIAATYYEYNEYVMKFYFKYKAWQLQVWRIYAHSTWVETIKSDNDL
jgi:hypothetical protein